MLPPSPSTAYTESPDLVVLVENALERNAETKGAALDILARGGTVVLIGTVANESVKATAENVARSVSGVMDVNNLIQVQASPG